MATLELMTDAQAELINGGFSLISYRPRQVNVIRAFRVEAEKGGSIEQKNVAVLEINLGAL